MRVSGKIDYVELSSPAHEETKAFYGAAFGWTFMDYGPTYAAFENAGIDGGLDQDSVSSHGDTKSPRPPLIVLYADDLDEVEATVIACGGTIKAPIFSFPGGRRFHFIDPSGNEMAVWSEV
jgi:uncharacterized protein